MKTLQFPTQVPPIGVVDLPGGKLSLRPGKRVLLWGERHSHSPGSLWLSSTNGQELEEQDVQRWALFHDILFDKGLVSRNHDVGELEYELRELDEDSDGSVDYSDVLPRAYFIDIKDSTSLPKRSYGELFENFASLEEGKIGLIKNCLMSFGSGASSTFTPIFDYSYWNIIPPFSVIETLLGQQPACPGIPICLECNRGLAGHHAVSTGEWWNKQMRTLIDDDVALDAYLRTVDVARKEIRNLTVHGSLHPKVEHQIPASGTYVYDSNRAVREFKSDAAALDALCIGVRRIARWLLLNDIFGLRIFPELSPLKVFAMRGTE